VNHRFEGEDRRTPERWKISKEVSIADLVSIALAFCAMFAAYNNLDKRIDRIEGMSPVQLSIDKRQDDEALRYQARIDSTLLAINGSSTD
jgi:hypothetical protein